MTRERKIGLALLGAGLLVVLAVATIVVIRDTRSLRYTLIFTDDKGLRAGDRVQMDGATIGKVQWVQVHTQPTSIDVRVKINPSHAEQIRVDSTAIINKISSRKKSGRRKGADRRVVEIINAEGEPASPPLSKNAIVYGVNSPLELQSWRLKLTLRHAGDALAQAIGALADSMENLSRTIQDISTSPETKRAISDLQSFMDRMNTQGRQAAEQLQREWPRLEQELQPVIKELHVFGRDYLADQIRQMMQDIERTLDQWNTPAPSPTPGR